MLTLFDVYVFDPELEKSNINPFPLRVFMSANSLRFRWDFVQYLLRAASIRCSASSDRYV